MSASVILGYLTNIATYMYDAFAMVYELGMQPLADTLTGNFTVLYTNPFNNVMVDFAFNIADLLRYFDITGFFLHSLVNRILEGILELIRFIPFGDYVLSMPTAFGVLLFSSIIFFVTCLVRLIVRVFA